jgi:hypothetical protein
MPDRDDIDKTQDPMRVSKSQDAEVGVIEEVTGSFLPDDDG